MASSLRDNVLHWKRKLQKATDDDTKLITIHKLSKIAITVELLQETGIGAVIRLLSKTHGKVGEKAAIVLANWRSAVSSTSKHKLKSTENGKSLSSHHTSHETLKEYSDYKSSKTDANVVKHGIKHRQKTVENVEPKPHQLKVHTDKYLVSDEKSRTLSATNYNDMKVSYLDNSLNSNSDQKHITLKSMPCDAKQNGRKLNSNDHKHSKTSSSDVLKSKILKSKTSKKSDIHLHEQKSKTIMTVKTNISNEESFLNSDISKKKQKLNKYSDEKNVLKSKVSEVDYERTDSSEAFTASEGRFEDFLNFNDTVLNKKRKQPKIKSLKKISLTEYKTVKRSEKDISRKKKQEKEKRHHKEKSTESIEVNISSTLPQTQPFYRPLPQRNIDYTPKKKALSNEDAIKFTSSRKEKTAVYSGKKTQLGYTDFPTLQECCQKMILDNFDFIGYVGNVPFNALQPVLEKCTAAQLIRFEKCNPHVKELTQDIWHAHCRKEYKLFNPKNDESWRELYKRADGESKQKLKLVKSCIYDSIKNSNPVRKIKLAYVDTIVKPPREVARRQARHGTGQAKRRTAVPRQHRSTSDGQSLAVAGTSSTPASSVAGTSSTAASSVSMPSTSRKRPNLASTAATPKKPKVAPLMAKTLKSMKHSFRR